MKPEETVRRMAEKAMERHRMKSVRDLASVVGCGQQAARHILNEEPVRLTTEQWLNLSALGGWFEKEEKHNG